MDDESGESMESVEEVAPKMKSECCEEAEL